MSHKLPDISNGIGDRAWEAWEAIETDFGPICVRSRLKDTYCEIELREFEVRSASKTWFGQNTVDVNGHQSFRVGSVFAIDSPDLALVGDNYASSLDAFVRFAIPYLISGRKPSDIIGKPQIYFDS